MLLPDRCHAGAILVATTILFESLLRIASRVGCLDEVGATFTQTGLLSSSSSLELWVIGSSQHVHFVYVDAVLCR